MAPHYQAATLITSPSYPNSITWSSENLVAVASGHIVTILVCAISSKDLLEPCLVPTFLVRDTEPCARSISWSRQGFAPNSGCLLAVCTFDGHVNLYRPPIWEFCDEWVELEALFLPEVKFFVSVADVSKLLFNYYKSINFGEDDSPDSIPQEKANSEQTHAMGCTGESQGPLSCSDLGRRKRKPSRFESYVYDEDEGDVDASKDADFWLNPCCKSKKISMKTAEILG
uniref:Transcription factor IIIC 90kDa subunit N-terminal domain-containing protein n=1 Tax=Triticum aestivum TaxID=4565 RepID=A0A077RYJ0_WHEAT|nr:unnamed protein product [Triticum aestivum]